MHMLKQALLRSVLYMTRSVKHDMVDVMLLAFEKTGILQPHKQVTYC